MRDNTSEQQLVGATSVQEVQSCDSTDNPSNQLAGATSVQEVQTGDSTDNPSNQSAGTGCTQEVQSGDSTENPSTQQLVGATSIPGVRNGNSLLAQFYEMKDRRSADQIEVDEDAHRGKCAEETDPSYPGLSSDPKVTPVNTASEGHE